MEVSVRKQQQVLVFVTVLISGAHLAVECQQGLLSTKIEYRPPAVKTPSQVSFSFQVVSAMDNPDRVLLNLPGFVLLDATAETNIQIGGNGAEYFDLYGKQAVWTPLTETLQLFVSKRITSASISLLFIDLFELPEAGLVGNDVRLRVTTSRNRNDLVEQLLWSQVLQSPAVGSFYSDTAATQTQVRWEKEPGRPRLEAGQAMSVRLSFYPHMRLYLKDSVSLTLPGFTATSGPVALILSEGSSQFFTAVLSLLALLVQKYKY
jgi:hypothetical protein